MSNRTWGTTGFQVTLQVSHVSSPFSSLQIKLLWIYCSSFCLWYLSMCRKRTLITWKSQCIRWKHWNSVGWEAISSLFHTMSFCKGSHGFLFWVLIVLSTDSVFSHNWLVSVSKTLFMKFHLTSPIFLFLLFVMWRQIQWWQQPLIYDSSGIQANPGSIVHHGGEGRGDWGLKKKLVRIWAWILNNSNLSASGVKCGLWNLEAKIPSSFYALSTDAWYIYVIEMSSEWWLVKHI